MMETARIDHDGTIETDYSDLDIERVHTEPTAENTGNPGYSAAILKMVKKMCKGSIADNNKRSRKIVRALNKEREKMNRKNTGQKVVKPPVKPVQRTFVDY